MGKVYQAVQHGAEGFMKTVAVKMIRSRYASDERFVEMFIGEAKLVADLVHQNIVQVYQLGRSKGKLYIVMEYVEGVNLLEFVQPHREKGRRIPIDLAAFVTSRIARGLEYAHKKTASDGAPLGVVHRDISTKNVMLTQLGEVKILDFGVAKARHMAHSDEKGRAFGKYNYMAPEQARLEHTDNRSDLYALGIVLWELLAGRNPFAGIEQSRERRERVRAGSVPPLEERVDDVPKMLLDILNRALQPDPADRYQDAGKMSYDLEYFMYHKGYGPTIVTLENYLLDLFGDRPAFRAGGRPASQKQMPDTRIVEDEGEPSEETLER
jgi:serine/threonine-protein kinase